MHRLIVCFFGLTLALTCADALRCYQCFDLENGACFNPTSPNANVETCTSQSATRSFPQELQQIFSEAETRSSSSNTAGDVRCYHYQTRQLLSNRTEVHRGCLSASYADTLCTALQNNGQMFYYNVTTCRTCNHDLCNSSARPAFTFLVSGSFLIIVFVLNKIR